MIRLEFHDGSSIEHTEPQSALHGRRTWWGIDNLCVFVIISHTPRKVRYYPLSTVAQIDQLLSP